MLVAEVRAVNNLWNPRIPGLSLPGVSSLASPIFQYADDTTFILSTDDSIKDALDTYSLFEKALGSRLNQSRSKGPWLPSWVPRLDPPVTLDWSSTTLKILGVCLGLGNLDVDNWSPRINSVEKRLCFLEVNAIFLSMAGLWSLMPLPCPASGMWDMFFTCLLGS